MAAQQLGLSQPAVSRLLHDLAASLKMPLFLRQGRKIVPTPDALALYGEVDQVLSGITRIDEMSSGARGSQGRQLRVAATPAPALGVMPAALRSFVALHPDIEIAMDMCMPRDLHDWATLGDFDIALAMMPMAHPDAMIVPLVRVDAVVAVPPGHALASLDIVRRDDLRTYPVILPPRYSLICAQWQAALRVDKPPELNDLFTTSALAACQWAEVGLGVAVVDLFNGLAMGERMVLRRLEPSLPLEYIAMFPRSRPRSRLAEDFLTHVTDYCLSVAAQWTPARNAA